MKYKISFIVPAYNAEKYIERCLKSLINQDVPVQIVVVNDASTDSTKQICESYAKTHNNIKLINLKQNGGVSNARNLAIGVAEGEFVYFVDADDYVLENSCKNLISNCDMVIFGKVYDHNGEISKAKFPYVGKITKNKLIKNQLKLFLNVHTSCWITNKLYKNKIIKKHKIKFEKNVEFSEDLLFNLQYFKYCKKIIFKEQYVTFYNRNVPNSLSRKYEKKNISEVIKNRENLFEYLNKFKIKNFKDYYIDTKNIIIYATKKVLKTSMPKNEKIKELNQINKIPEIVEYLDKQKPLELLLYNYIKNKDLKILECDNEKL
ncbi:MAG: glycosyltransferase family 2 protein [Clostridia bacterium]|nr:glycosyltransferase family 2 protein [Clostridia bacterium]